MSTESFNEIERFLTTVWGGGQEGYLVVTPIKNGPLPSLAVSPSESSSLIGELIQRNRAGENIFGTVGLNESRPEHGSRVKENTVCAVPGIFMDVDINGVGHASDRYPPSEEEALRIVNGVVGFPPSRIIRTGGGLHVWWLYDRLVILDSDEARRRAKNRSVRVKSKFQELAGDYKVDSTADLARLVRIPGTLNHKYDPPQLVTVEYNLNADGGLQRYSPEAFDNLALFPEVDSTRNSRPRSERTYTPSEVEAGEGTAKAGWILEDCGFMRHCRDDAATLVEPEWFSMLSILAGCEDGESTALKFSEPYGGFSIAEFRHKWGWVLSRDAGPHTCAHIGSNVCSDFCQSCDLRGALASPISLGYKSGQETKIVTRMNKDHAQVMFHGKDAIFIEERDRNGRIVKYEHTDQSELRKAQKADRYNLIYQKKGGGLARVPHVDVWLSDDRHRQYRAATFDPSGSCQPDVYNTFLGFAFDPVPGNWQPMRDYIQEVIASGNTEHAEYIEKWMAYTVQNMGKRRVGVALGLRGGQGTGKTTFAKHFGALFGSAFKPVFDDSILRSEFNAGLDEACLVLFDEAIFSGDKRLYGKIKGLITETKTWFNKKFANRYLADLHFAAILCSNDDVFAHMEIDDRRYFTVTVSDCRTQDHAYFHALSEHMKCGGYAAMLHDLLTMDLAGFYPERRPESSENFRQKLASNPMAQAVYDCLNEGGVIEQGERSFILKRALYMTYQAVMESGHHGKAMADNHFFRTERGTVMEWLPPNCAKTRVRIQGEREEVIQVPSLDECRNHFAERIGQASVPWDVPETWGDDEPTPFHMPGGAIVAEGVDSIL